MKKQFNLILASLCCVCLNYANAQQQSLCYPLESNLLEKEESYSALSILLNTQNEGGNFVNIPSNNNLCNTGEELSIFYFEKNAGLQFDNSESFLDCEYTIEFVFKLENFPGLFDQPWLKILGFANDDTGFFIYKVPFFGDLVFEVWENNTQLTQCPLGFFNEQDWFQFTVTRNCFGMMSFYVNCQLMCTYDDSMSQLFFPQPSAGNQIIFFQDDPAILAAEASSGWIKNLKISNFPKEESMVAEGCNCFCEELVGCEEVFNSLSFTCDPEQVVSVSDTIPSSCSCACDTILFQEIILQATDTTFLQDVTCDPEATGGYFQYLENIYGCDSIVVLNISLQESPFLQDAVVTPDSGNEDGNISIDITGGVEPYSYLWSTGDTTFSIFNLSAGTYSVTVVDQNGCDVTLEFEVDLVNGLSELETSNLQIFPNPISVGASLKLYFTNTNTQNLTIEIFDVHGRQVFQLDRGMPSNHFLTLNLHPSISEGIYFLKIKNESGQNWVEKIMVFR